MMTWKLTYRIMSNLSFLVGAAAGLLTSDIAGAYLMAQACYLRLLSQEY